MSTETRYQRVAREQHERTEAREAATKAARRRAIPGGRFRSGPVRRNHRRDADRIDGYDRDDLGHSPDY